MTSDTCFPIAWTTVVGPLLCWELVGLPITEVHAGEPPLNEILHLHELKALQMVQDNTNDM